MPKFAELGLTSEKLGEAVDFSTMPEQRKGFAPLPQPGPYRFKVPVFDAASPIFDTITTQKGPRLNLKFEDSFALTIIQSPGGTHNGETLGWRLSNQKFNTAKKGAAEVLVSDMDYILRDVLKEAKAPADTNAAYGQAMIKLLSGKEFTAELEFTWRCSDKTDIRVDDGAGGTTVVENQKGCGARYYQGGTNGVQKVRADETNPDSPLVYPERITCSGVDGVACGAVVRAFSRLRNFRA